MTTTTYKRAALVLAVLAVLGAAGAAPVEQTPWKEFSALTRTWRQKNREARELVTAAHAALDRAEYELAVNTHMKARQALMEADQAKSKLESAIRTVVAAKLEELDAQSFEAREKATVDLTRLGPAAAKIVEEAMAGKSAEVQTRLKDVLSRLDNYSEDDQGRLHQWASDATASSQFGDPSWSAKQATGKPNTMTAGDITTAWAARQPDGGLEWLELTYDVPVHPVMVRVHETYNPGAVVKVEGQDGQGQWHTLWEGQDKTAQAPGWLEVPVKRPAWTCKVVKLTVDEPAVPGWNEIDAVELIGDPEE